MAGRKNDIASRVLGFVVTLLGSGWLALQTPQVQTGLAEKLLDRVAGDFGGSISFGEISIEPVNTFTVKHLAILDANPYDPAAPLDTLFSAESISGKISFGSILSGKGVRISRLRVDDSMLAIAIEPDTVRTHHTITNLERIFGMPEPVDLSVRR